MFLKAWIRSEIFVKKSLHDYYDGRPKLWELAKKIAFNTPLEYDDDGFLNIDFTVLQEKFWKNNRPCYVKEANKVLNFIHALLLSSSKKRDEEIHEAKGIYSQSLPGINDPVLKSMCFGPDSIQTCWSEAY